jgi:hypothetical protein
MSTPPTDPAVDAPWRPTTTDVAALLRARTKDASGNELGDFTSATRPTDLEVERLITNGCAKVSALVGWDIPDDALDEARHLASIVAACEVELSYWPEQVRSDRSAFTQLWEIFQADVAAFREMVSALAPAGGLAAGVGSFYTPSSTVDFAYRYGYAGLATPLSDLVNVGLGGGSEKTATRRRR